MKYRNYISVLVLSALVLVIGWDTPMTQAQNTNEYCVLVAEEFGGGSLGCFASEVEAVRVATGGAVNLPSNASTEEIHIAIEQAQSKTVSASDTQIQSNNISSSSSSSTVVGILYDNVNFGGSGTVLTVTDPNGCNAGVGYTYNLTNSWDNRVESARGFQGCLYTEGFDNDDWTGASYKCPNDCATFLAINNDIESVIVMP